MPEVAPVTKTLFRLTKEHVSAETRREFTSSILPTLEEEESHRRGGGQRRDRKKGLQHVRPARTVSQQNPREKRPDGRAQPAGSHGGAGSGSASLDGVVR